MSKLKLFLLGGILSILTIGSFSSATVYTFSSDGGEGSEYTPFEIGVPSNIVSYTVNSISNYSCSSEDCGIMIEGGGSLYCDTIDISSYSCNGGDFPCSATCEIVNPDDPNIILMFNSIFDASFSSASLDITFTTSGNEGGNEGGDTGGGNEGGDIGGGDTGGGNVITNGFQALSPAVNGLHETVKQLLPLVIYLGIGILVFTLGFFAIRWLVNWLGGKINSNFSSKRD